MLPVIAIAASGTATEKACDAPLASEDARHGVFFKPDEFPGTGKIANQKLTVSELEQKVSEWRTAYSPGPLTAKQHAQFFDDGFVVLPSLLPADVLQNAVRSVEKLVDDLAEKLHAAGKISAKHADAGFMQRLVRIEEEFPHASVLLHKNGVLPPGIQTVWSHSSLMSVAEQLLGPDGSIGGHPVWNLRCKTPEAASLGQATVPWHQDNAYMDEESWGELQLTAWVPLVDTNATNGCMQVVKGGRKHTRLQP